MQDPHAGGCIAGHCWRSSLASRVLWSCDRHARRTYCGGSFLAALDATTASPGDHYRKSKLLVLPAYPAAWPQAKKHPFVQASFRFYCYFTTLHLMQKTGYRYRQAELAVAETADVLWGTVPLVGLSYWSSTVFAKFNGLAAWASKVSRAAMTHTVDGISRLPLIGSIGRSYAAHYNVANQQHADKFSKKVSGFLGRWSIKFSAEYYQAKEKDHAAKRHSQVKAGSDQPSGIGRPRADA